MFKDVEAAISDQKRNQVEVESKERQKEREKELVELEKTHKNHLEKRDIAVREQMQNVAESRHLADSEHNTQIQRLSEEVTKDAIKLKSEWEGRLKSENDKNNARVQGVIKDANELKTRACEEHKKLLRGIRKDTA